MTPERINELIEWPRKDTYTMTTDQQPGPAITFRLPEAQRPTLDQFPEGEPHLGDYDDGGTYTKVVYVAHHEGEVRTVDRDGNLLGAVMADGTGRVKPSEITVLDCDPPEPQTLADVLDLCLAEATDGTLYSKWDSRSWIRTADNLLEYEASGLPPSEVKIARVLGYPQLSIAPTPKEGQS